MPCLFQLWLSIPLHSTFPVFFCLFLSLSPCLSLMFYSFCLSVHLSVCMSLCLSVCLFVCLFICLFVCLSVCLSFCLSVFPFMVELASQGWGATPVRAHGSFVNLPITKRPRRAFAAFVTQLRPITNIERSHTFTI